MNAIWNLLVSERPPHVTWQITPLDAKKRGVEIARLKAVLSTAIHDLESMSDLHLNATVLSRLIYRMKSKFRNDKGLKCMMKLNKALLNYYNMSLKKEYTNLRSDLEMEDGMYFLPSKQMLEYVLVRTQGFGKLMTRIEEVSRYASHFLSARIKLGHAWNVALVAYGTISRIWFFVRIIIKKCCKWYDELYQCAEQFQYVGTRPWLPANQSLPRNLKSWLCLNWLDADTIDNDKSEPWQKIFGKPLEGEVSNDTNDTPFIILNEKTGDSRLTHDEVASTNNVLEDKSISNNDIGESVDREVFERSLPPNNRFQTTKRKHTDTDEKRKLKEPKRKKK